MARAEEVVKIADPLEDAALQPFLQDDFDAASYWNSMLPALQTATDNRSTSVNAAPITEVLARAQILLTKLNSQTTRLSNSLTQLTDEIIRSGGKLAYEVELLRGEAIGLSETLHDGLKEELEVFLVNDTPAEQVVKQEDSLNALVAARGKSGQPSYLCKLQILTIVRDRLDEVMRLFDEALKWPMVPPAAAGLASGIISVSNPISNEDSAKLDAQAREHIDTLRKELNALLREGGDGGSTALRKMQRLRAVAEVWKGTAEEKPRIQVIDDLQKLVNEQYKDDSTTASSRTGMDYRSTGPDIKSSVDSGYGFLSNLRNLKNEVYLD